ncbi:MAG: hypothetical protein K2X35_09120 [Bryobacteraceae bacterium]|nr:hypothetical protein [Bryobacteraceae bacterium]
MKGKRLGRWSVLLFFSLSPAPAQPVLTAIQDTLYKADGTRYNGTMRIRWRSFEAGDQSNIATSDLTVEIVNGVLRVRLAPTTTATAGAQYEVAYESRGRLQFTETWAVPPSATPLRIRQVRTGQGSVVGPPPANTQITIPDVAGLSNELLVRPIRGPGFTASRAAVINAAGQMEGASGDAGDCVRVDGSASPCGAGGGGGGGILPQFADGEVPAGLVNGVNTVFTLNFAPSPGASLALFKNGVLQRAGTDFLLSGSTITFLFSSAPQTGDVLQARYRYGDPGNPLASFTAAQTICSGTGTGTSSTALISLGSCSIPAGVLGAGDRIEIRFQYEHTGGTTGFGAEVRWGSTAVVSRSVSLLETTLFGRAEAGLHGAGGLSAAQSWGALSAVTAAAGSVAFTPGQGLTVEFRGQMSAASSDTVWLRNFTVIRYPAQGNP